MFEQALPLYRVVGDRLGEAVTLGNIGAVYNTSGELQKALDYFKQSLSIFHAVGERSGEATTLNDIGEAYEDLGETQKALDYFEQALITHRAAGGRPGEEAATLNNIGTVYDALGEKQKALAYFEQALPLYRAVGNNSGEATALNSIGALYYTLGENQQALDYFRQALPIRRAVGDRHGEAVTLGNIGAVYNRLGEMQKALDYFGQALPLDRAVGDRRGEAIILFNIAVIERNRGNLSEALTRIEAALSIIESLRTNITNQDLRLSFFATVQQDYLFYIDLLMRLHKLHPAAGHDARALQVSERARARSLLDTLSEAGADIRQGVSPHLVARERTLQQQLNVTAQEQVKLLSSRHTEAQAAALAKELESLTTQVQQVETEIRQTSPRYAALTKPQPLTLKEIQTQVLDADTLLLEYSLDAERSYLWAVTPTSSTSYELPKREEIEAAARKFYESISSGQQAAGSAVTKREISGELQRQANARSAQVAAQLSQMLLAPVAGLLGKKRLLIVADGALQYIPFAALPAPTAGTNIAPVSPLIVEHEIVSLPSASTLAVLRREAGERKRATKTLAVLADPVFESDDERLKVVASKAQPSQGGVQPSPSSDAQRNIKLVVSQAAQESGVATQGAGVTKLYIPRLPATRHEANEIIKLVPPNGRKESLDFAASRAAAIDPGLGNYRFVHFATHGFLNSQHPELSGIVLSMFDEWGHPQDGFLRAHEVFNLKLSADLVVLSACETGLGKEVKGEGLVGLTRGFMYAGAPRVVVSLWSVNDTATAELMTRFYRGMLVDKLRPAQALQAAQISMLSDKRFAAPFYWAAFTLQGEWR